MERIEYRVRPVTRYVVTCYHGTDNNGSVCERGEFDNEETAYQVGYALAKADHDRMGWPAFDDRIQYPTRPSEESAVPCGGSAA